jgi:hypothetical protein
MVLLIWYGKPCSSCKFKYDATDTNWIDVNAIVSTVSFSYEKERDLYWLDSDDAKNMDNFV